MAPTAHAGASAWISEKYQTADGEDTGFWWLRSPGMNQNNASVVLFAGNLYGRYDVDLDFVCVRPVLWVNMK